MTMIHRQGAGLLGALFARYINLDDSEQMMQQIAQAGDRPIDLVLHTPGGLVIAAEQIARVLAAHKPGVTVIVPQYAMSGGTFLAMAADQIIMDQNAMLGPVDPQLNNMPAAAYARVMREKEKNAIADETIMMADMAEKATVQLRQMVVKLLERKMGADRAGEIATMMTDGRWTHDYPLHVEALQEMGFPVSTAIPQEFWQLLGLSNASQQSIMRKAETAKKQ
ncbi:MAG TPA: ATP-dependent Clp protease proteolytic subunit [Symbiobacteriaceae bacterium]|jgi:ClpP class serine protease|nr:ATP-dependent Clp protease proteolytic subunit [Symbiobacteriaceae bacterium]